MQRLFFSFFTLYFLFFTSAAQAAPTPKAESAITELKERIASRVAQLQLVEKRGIVGVVNNVTNTQLTVIDVRKDTRLIDVDEFTKFASPSAKPPAGGSFGISDIVKGETVGIIGLYNKQSRHLMARFVDVVRMPIFLSGAVEKVDAKTFTLTVATTSNENFTVDVTTTTKTQGYTKETGLVRSGFSKVSLGQRIFVVGFPNLKEASKISALRIIHFSSLPHNPNINLSPKPSPTETPTPIKSGPTPTPRLSR